MGEEMTHKSLLEQWGNRFPREKLCEEDGTVTVWGKKALREISGFKEKDVEDAMHIEMSKQGKNYHPRITTVIAYLKQRNAIVGENHWLDNVLSGTVVRSGSHTGLVSENQVWIERKTPVYETSYFAMVLPDSLQNKWAFLDPIKAGAWKETIRERIEKGEFDGGVPDRWFADALRIDPKYICTPQRPCKKPDPPEAKKSGPTVMRIGEIRFNAPPEGTTAPKTSTLVDELLDIDAEEEAAIRAEQTEIVPGSAIGTIPEGDALF